MRKEPGPVAPEDPIEEAAGADYDLARRRVRSIVEGPTLDDFLRRVEDYRNRTYPAETKRVRKVRMKDEDKDRIGHLFVAALNDPTRKALPLPAGFDSTPTRLVRLSPETAVKQVINHRDLTTADYRRIPDVIEHGDFGPDPQKDGRVLVFLRTIDNRYAYKAVIKQTPNNEVFLLSFRMGKIAELRPLHRGKPTPRVNDSGGSPGVAHGGASHPAEAGNPTFHLSFPKERATGGRVSPCVACATREYSDAGRLYRRGASDRSPPRRTRSPCPTRTTANPDGPGWRMMGPAIRATLGNPM